MSCLLINLRLYYLFDGSKLKLSQKCHSSRIRGRGESSCSNSLVCKESCHENCISYKTHAKDYIYIFFNLKC